MGHVIDRFDGDFAFLSNFAACPVDYADDGQTPVTYPSVEHAFQAAKTLSWKDRERLARTASPLTAKRIGRQVTMRPEWDVMRLVVMKALLRQKFEREPFHTLLVATGDAEMVEGNDWHDQFWGDCVCPAHVEVPGRNALGGLLVEVRREVVGSRPSA